MFKLAFFHTGISVLNFCIDSRVQIHISKHRELANLCWKCYNCKKGMAGRPRPLLSAGWRTEILCSIHFPLLPFQGCTSQALITISLCVHTFRLLVASLDILSGQDELLLLPDSPDHLFQITLSSKCL